MQIGYLPKVFSHLLMVVLGMGLYNVFTPAVPQPDTPKFRSGHVYMALVRRMLISEDVQYGQEVDFLIMANGLRCRLNLRGVRLQSLQSRSLLVGMPKKNAHTVLAHLQRGELQAVYKVGSSDTQVRDVCGRKTTVVYGVH